MRDDLNHVVGEHGRTKGPSHKTRHWSPPYRHTLEDDGSPTRVPMRPRQKSVKEWTIRYKPLLRSLRSHVGKPWNKTYSQIRHIFRRQTLLNLTALKYVDSLIIARPGWSSSSFTVNPDTGVLEAVPVQPTRWPCTHHCMCPRCWVVNPLTGGEVFARDFRLIDQSRYAERESGIWYIYTIGQEPLARRQAGRKMLRCLGVRNA